MDHESSPRSLRSQLGRGAVLLSSGSLAVLLVSRSGPGCGGGSTTVDAPAPQPAAAPAATAPSPAPTPTGPVSEPVKVQPVPVNAPPPQPAADAPPQPNKAGPMDGKGDKNNAGDAPHYFPASKAGVFVEIKQAPQQQAGPR